MFKTHRKYWAIATLIFAALNPAQSYTKDDIGIDEPGIASAHPLATQVGFKILEEGGNAGYEMSNKITKKNLKTILPTSNERSYGKPDNFWCMGSKKRRGS